MIKIVCTSCQKPLSLDETKLPMKEVSFPCPVCKTKLTVDRRNLGGEAAAPEPPAAAPPPQPASDAGGNGAEEEEGFGSKALVVGNDHPAVRQAVKLIGFLPVHIPTPEKAREFYNQEVPQVVVINPPQITPPPLEGYAPIISLTPTDRRKSFFILIADNLRTLDGNAAFLYGVNLVVATKDLPQFPQIYREAFGFHERFYGAMNAVFKSLSA
ncbi:MAG TPA: hypothetical protein VNL91_02945 [Thermoanaerobaculia bacterium]|nr:hypothetical protein [Thermoanaerobaculia bacterium]